MRAKTINLRKLRKEVELCRDEKSPTNITPPRTSEDCLALLANLSSENLGCPFVSCRLNTYLDELESGSIKFNFPDAKDPLEVPTAKSCVLLIVISNGFEGLQLEEIEEFLGVETREAVRIIECVALGKLSRNAKMKELAK